MQLAMLAKVTKVNPDIAIDSSPKIIEFENGTLSSNREVLDKIRFDLHRPKFQQSKNHEKDILVADTGNMKYIGNQINVPCKYYIGVLDKHSGDMEIYNTDMFKMQPAIMEENNRKMVAEGEVKETSYIEKNDRLVEAFGTARQRRAVSARKKNVIDKEEMSNKILEVAGNIDLTATSQDSQDSPTFTITPPINLLGSSPAQLYNIEDIISPEDESAILEDSDEFTDVTKDIVEKWKSENRYPEYILEHLTCLPNSEDSKRDKVVQLRYLSYLIQFFKLTYADLRRKDVLGNVPLQIKNRLFAQFSLEKDKKRFVPKRFKDKALCYILLLALIIDEYMLDCTTIMRDLKLGPARIGIHLKAIGCSVESKRSKKNSDVMESGQKSMSKTFATLKVPLPINFLQRKETS